MATEYSNRAYCKILNNTTNVEVVFEHQGCCSHIKNFNGLVKQIKIYVPKEHYDFVIKSVGEKTLIDYYKTLNFNLNWKLADLTKEEREIISNRVFYSSREFIEFTFSEDTYKKWYYVFCSVRDIYYNTTALISLLNNFKEGICSFDYSNFNHGISTNYYNFAIDFLDNYTKYQNKYTSGTTANNEPWFDYILTGPGRYKERERGGKYEYFVKNNYNGLFVYERPVEKHKLKVLSRHPSHAPFRELKLDYPTLYRFGSTTVVDESKYTFKINSIESINNSSNKLLMKQLFVANKINTPEYWTTEDGITFNDLNVNDLPFPIIAKNIFGSRGSGNYKLDSADALKSFLKRRVLSNYIFEKFKNYGKEYRIHVSSLGVFLTWRKVRKLDTPLDQKWFFNNQNCNWLSVTHPNFDRPSNMEIIYKECQKALAAVGLTIGACDVRVAKDGKFSIIEINSAPSMAEVTFNHYVKEINKLCI